MQNKYYMTRALKLAQRGRFITHPSPNIGCVIVKDGEIVGEGYHQRADEPHVEVHASRTVGEKPRVRSSMSHSNPVAIMVVRHRAVTHSSPLAWCAWLPRCKTLIRRPLGVDFTIYDRLALASTTG